MKRLLSFATLLLVSFSAWAGTPNPPQTIPEPVALVLLGLGALGLYLTNKQRR